MSVALIDTHCHLNFDGFDTDRDAVLERARLAGVTRIIIPAVDAETTEQALALAARESGIYAAAGIHPNDTAGCIDEETTRRAVDQIAALAVQPGIVAIGEIGLDYHWDTSPKEAQRRAFEAQLALAAERRLPVIIHNRDASDDVIAILEAWTRDLPPELRARPGVLHSFSASMAIAARALECGFYLGFTGPITYKNADNLRQIAARVPLDRILIETDAPFLTPTPHRGQRNEPAYVALVAERLATLCQIPLAVLADATTANAIRLFALPA
ncbi:MAG: TatD family hydrolase [Chloroflexota bacterium]|nr:TatD family hydrolase [Chloroflexota bacterium]